MNVKKLIFTSAGALLLVGVLVASNALAKRFEPMITDFLYGTGNTFEGEEVEYTAQIGDELVINAESDSIVMMKNDGALPLDKEFNNKINLFGAASADKYFLLKGIGSGSSTIRTEAAVSLIKALEDGGFECNPDLVDFYKGISVSRNNYGTAEPSYAQVESHMAGAVAYSDTALVVFARNGGENIGEAPTAYAELSSAEQELLNGVKENFDNVIVILNTTNTIHGAFLADDDVNACLYVGITGQSGARAIPKILSGEVNPSGKLTDTYIYNNDYDVTFNNHTSNSSNITYTEDIYIGYKFFETADAEGLFDGVNNSFGTGYDGVVARPFGYGESYTEFSWTLVSSSVSNTGTIPATGENEIKVKVTNTGSVAGKDVVELFCTPPYIDGGIEKAAVNLVDFAKTHLLEPGQSETVSLKWSAYDIASYDCYDKNDNGSATYELDGGDYEFSFRTDAHNKKEGINSLTFKVGNDGIVIDKDPVTGTTIQNYFTGDSAYAGVRLDRSNVGVNATYLSRSNFAGTFAQARVTAARPSNSSLVQTGNRFTYEGFNQSAMPDHSMDAGLRLITLEDGSYATKEQLEGNWGEAVPIYNDELIDQLCEDPESDMWDYLIDQMTPTELKALVENGGFRNCEVVSIGKPYATDYDGPAGFNTNTRTGNLADSKKPSTDKWTAYPSEALLGCSWNKTLMLEMGLSMGKEAEATNCNGWYAPGVNLHRSIYNGRNFEYYSEDPVLSGKLAANVIHGAKMNNLYTFIKHFAASELGQNPQNVNTWLTEQNFRENYLKPFEIAVKEGGALGVMTAFNRIGATWCGACKPMLEDILRDEWGFQGAVITDWTTGAGVGSYGSPYQGVRAGNDLWLNPNNQLSGSLDLNDATNIYCFKRAARHIVSAFINAYYYAKTYDRAALDAVFGDHGETSNKYAIDLSVRSIIKPEATWWTYVIIIDVVLGLAALTLIGINFIPSKKKKAE